MHFVSGCRLISSVHWRQANIRPSGTIRISLSVTFSHLKPQFIHSRIVLSPRPPSFPRKLVFHTYKLPRMKCVLSHEWFTPSRWVGCESRRKRKSRKSTTCGHPRRLSKKTNPSWRESACTVQPPKLVLLNATFELGDSAYSCRVI